MVSPAMFPQERPSALLTAFQRWREWAFEFEQSRLQMEFIMVIPRTLVPEKLQSDVATFIELHREGLMVGVALVGERLARVFKGSPPPCSVCGRPAWASRFTRGSTAARIRLGCAGAWHARQAGARPFRVPGPLAAGSDLPGQDSH